MLVIRLKTIGLSGLALHDLPEILPSQTTSLFGLCLHSNQVVPGAHPTRKLSQ